MRAGGNSVFLKSLSGFVGVYLKNEARKFHLFATQFDHLLTAIEFFRINKQEANVICV